jgi:hypothetical protein
MGTNLPGERIAVVCACGAKLNASRAMLGKRAKCPKCGAALLIAEPTPAGAIETAPEPSQATPGPPVAANFAPEPLRPAPTNVLPTSPTTQPTVLPVALRRRGLERVDSNYQIKLPLWWKIAIANYRAIAFPAAGFMAIFIPCFLVSVLFLGAPIGMIFDHGTSRSERLLGYCLLPFGFLPSIFLLPALAAGLHVVCQRQLLGKPWSFGTFFAGFRQIGSHAGATALVTLLYFVPLLLSQVLLVSGRILYPGQPTPWLAGLAGALNAGLGLAVGYAVFRLVMFPHYLVIDRDCGPLDALRGSWRLTHGHFWSWVGVGLLIMVGSVGVSIVTLGFGLLVAVPLMALVLNAGYLLIAGSEPIPGFAFDSQERNPARPTAKWLAPAAVVSVSLAGALLGGFFAYHTSAGEVAAIARAMQQKAAAERRYQIQRAQQEAEAKGAAEELVAWFREGGWWSVAVSPEVSEAPAVPAGLTPGEGSSSAGPSIGLPGGGQLGGSAAGNDESAPWNQLAVVIIGPKELLDQVPSIELRVAGQLPTAQRPAPNFEPLTAWNDFRRPFLLDSLSAAIDRQEIVAVVVQMKRPLPAGGSAGPGSASGAVPPPSLPSAPGEAATAPGLKDLDGLEVSLKTARPLTGQQFRERIQTAQ